MKVKNKVIIFIILFIMCILLDTNISQASYKDVQDLAEKGKESVGELIDIDVGDMISANNELIYCMLQGQTNKSTARYKVLTYVEIENGIATVWDVEGRNGQKSEQSDANKILAEILSGTYGLGYGSSVGQYSKAQQGLYCYFEDWIEAIGISIGTDHSWDARNNFKVNDTALKVINDAKDAVTNGANASLKFYLLDPWNGVQTWQRLLVAVPGENKKAQLVIRKEDKDDKTKLRNVGFKIKWDDAPAEDQQLKEPICYVKSENGIISYVKESEATEFKTDRQGLIIIEGLNSGYYTVTETTNPNEGYNTSKNIGKKVKVLVDTNAEITVKITNEKDDDDDDEPEFEDVEGKISISGTVWVAKLDYKDNSYDDTFNFSNFSDNKGNIRLEGINVTWLSPDSEEPLGTATTNKDGYYEMSNTISIHTHSYKVDSKQWEMYNNSYVEFEYNGFKYTTVAWNDLPNGSRAKEIDATRTALDNKFKEVSNGTVKDGRFNIVKEPDQNGDGYHYTADVRDQGIVKATTQNNLNSLMDNYASGSNSGEEYCTAHRITYDGRCSKVNCSGKHRRDHCDKIEKKNDIWTISNINLGLVEREQPDVAITSDIAQVRVIMKGQQYTYIYGNRGITNPEKGLFEMKVKFGKTYTRKVNPADIAYINQQNSNEMEVYVTYNIKVKNHSNTLPVSINQIANYYDSRYSINGNPSGWSDEGRAGNGFNVAYYNTPIRLQPNATSDVISIEYKVNNDTIKNLLTGNQTLKNVSEITSYTTFYGPSTICSEHRTASSAGRTGKQYAGVDRNSMPGNYNINNDGPYEDDTSDAPSFELIKDPNYKIVSGNVYEDTTSNNIAAGRERNGDGINNSEPGVGHVRVELLKRDGTVATLYSAEGGRVGTAQAITYTDRNGNYAFGYNEGTKPTYYNNAQDTTGNNSYSKMGVIADDYIIRFTYGDGTQTYIGNANNKISARNYKSTIITNNNNDSIYGVIHNNNGNDKWHLTATNNRSIAIDDLGVRNSIDTSLKHSTFDDIKDISAYTMPFKVQLEYTQDQTFNVEENGNRKELGDFEHDWTIFDFGIVERAREDIVIDKTISNLKITLGNGQILMDGNPRTDTMNYLKYLGNDKNQNHPNRTRTEALTKQSKLAYIEMDTELIQGATLDIIYTITVTNNSEKDYDYRTDEGRYYYYADKSSSQEMPTTVELVADYMDPELTCYVNGDTEATADNQKWVKTTGDALRNNELISENVKNTLGNGQYLIFITDYFKDVKTTQSKSLTLHASKLLANSAEDYVYENHTEILQTNGQIARTIDKVDYRSNSNQVVKTYTPGNYIPSLSNRHTNANGTLEEIGLHQQDDDAITIRITPPTGAANYTSYIITGVIGLIVIAGVIIIIKKKVLDK